VTYPNTPGSLRRVHIRLLPWKPRWRTSDREWDPPDLLDVRDDPISAVIGLVLMLLLVPFVLLFVVGVVLLSAELLLLLALVPLLMLGQLVGMLPWQLGLTLTDRTRRYVEVTGTAKMLAARRYYRTLRA
jgi:hypothetical protein